MISALYPSRNPYLEISYQELGPFSPKIDLVFRDLLAEGICKINGDYLEILPCSINENDHFIEISELFIHKLIVYCNNKILDPFETIELFSIISVEQARLNHSQNVFRPMTTISLENKKLLIIRVKNSMKYTKLLSRFVLNYSPTYVYNFINERIDDFYDALRTSKFFDIYKS